MSAPVSSDFRRIPTRGPRGGCRRCRRPHRGLWTFLRGGGCIACVAVVCLGFAGGVAAEINDDEVQEGFVELFDGQSLLGWQTVRAGGWAAQEGVLTGSQGTDWIHTGGVFDDFTLRLEVRIADGQGSANIWFRTADGRGKSRPAEGHRVSLATSAQGPALVLAGGGSHPLAGSALKPIGEWNQCEIRCRGSRVEVALNGNRVASNEAGGPAAGLLGLEVTGGEAEFRNLRIREEGGRPLLADGGLSGWQVVGSGETIWSRTEEGYLACSGERGGWISTIDRFDNFTLSLGYLLEPGGNSGVYVRAPHEGHISRLGMEIQVLDDGAEKYANLKPYQYTGSIYAVVPPARRLTRPAGQWNRLQIQCSDRQVSTWVNGRLVVSAALDGFEELAGRPRKGYLGFQNHNSRILYRNVVLKTPPQGRGGLEAAGR